LRMLTASNQGAASRWVGWCVGRGGLLAAVRASLAAIAERLMVDLEFGAVSGNFHVGDNITQTGDGNVGKLSYSGGPERNRGVERGEGSNPAATPPWDGGSAGVAEPLTSIEIRELAAVFGCDVAARQLLVEAGVLSERIPPPGSDATSFWTTVAALLGHGLLRDGRHRILRTAARCYPANAVFGAAGT